MTDGREVPLRCKHSRECSTPLMMSGSPRPHLRSCQIALRPGGRRSRLLLDVLADVPARRSVPVDHVHKCHRRISGKDEVGLRFPWAYHASQREAGNAVEELRVFWADVAEVAFGQQRMVSVPHDGCQIRNHISFVYHTTLRNRAKMLPVNAYHAFPLGPKVTSSAVDSGSPVEYQQPPQQRNSLPPRPLLVESDGSKPW